MTDTVIEHYKDGRPTAIRRVIEPARWSMASVASMINSVREHSRDIPERRRGAPHDPTDQLIDEQECEALLLKLREDEQSPDRLGVEHGPKVAG